MKMTVLFLALGLSLGLVLGATGCGPNWGYVCVGENCPGGGGDENPADPDAGCPITEPTDPGDGGPTEPTDPGDGGTEPTDPGDGGTPGDGGDGKTCICHIPKGKPSNAHTICIGEPAVSAHLAHGDYLGECQEN